MTSNTNLRYQGSIAHLRGETVVQWNYCTCSKCYRETTSRVCATVEFNGGRRRIEHARHSSIVQVQPDTRSREEAIRDLAVALGAI